MRELNLKLCVRCGRVQGASPMPTQLLQAKKKNALADWLTDWRADWPVAGTRRLMNEGLQALAR